MYIAALLVELVLWITEMKTPVLRLDLILYGVNGKAQLTSSDFLAAEKTKYGFISSAKEIKWSLQNLKLPFNDHLNAYLQR